jgi:hypothetical protein
MDADEDDALDAFMADVSVAVKQDLQSLDPAVARDALAADEDNPVLATAGIKREDAPPAKAEHLIEMKVDDADADAGSGPPGGADVGPVDDIDMKAEPEDDLAADMAADLDVVKTEDRDAAKPVLASLQGAGQQNVTPPPGNLCCLSSLLLPLCSLRKTM